MKYIVTNIQFNGLVNANLLKNIQRFAKDQGVDHLYTFVQNGSYRDEDIIDPRVLEAGFEPIDAMTLNSNLRLKDMKILAQQINPMTGMSTKLSRDYSYIMPSAKIRYLSVANTSRHPRAFMTTGNLTKPNYKLHTAQGRKALEQHQYGFVLVEIRNGRKFSTYQVEATKAGDFHYMGTRYVKGRKLKAQPEALVLGDLHYGDTNPRAYKRSMRMIEELRPKRVVLHDVFNGHSINPHEKGHLMSELSNARNGRDSLTEELAQVHKELDKLAKRFPKIEFIISESNHDIFLYRYIDGKEFMDHPHNFLPVAQMIPLMLEGEKPTLQIALELIDELPGNINFLKEDQECRVRGVELGYHGHKGLNGSRGSSASFDRFNLRMITAHEHSPKLFANGMVVGTNTHLKLPYTKGASSWMHANGILYTDGKYGLLPFVF